MRTRSRSMMLLLEIVIMLLVFAVCASVCLSLFAASRKMAKGAEELSEAAMWAQSAAEVYKSAKGDLAETAKTLSATVSGARLELWLDGAWQPGGNVYLLAVDGGEDSAAVTVSRDGETIYVLNIKAVTYG